MMQYDESYSVGGRGHRAMKKKLRYRKHRRLTVTLANGQREELEDIAKRNNATLAFVVRYAVVISPFEV